MTTYEVPASRELLPDLLDPENRGRPETWRSVTLVSDQPYGDPAWDQVLVRVEDDSGPVWAEGKLIEPSISVEYEENELGRPTGNILRAWVSGYREIQRRMTVPTIADAVRESRANPGTTVTVDESGER